VEMSCDKDLWHMSLQSLDDMYNTTTAAKALAGT
jgi:hypothetical protein